MNVRIALLCLAAATATACNRTVPPEAWTLTVTPLPLDAATGSAEAQLTTSPRGTIVSWVETAESTATLRYAERTGGAWSTPRTVASGDDWFLSYADTPAVLRLSDGTLVANLQKTTNPDTEAYDLLLTWSRDEGKTWSAPVVPHHDGTKTMHGFASMLEMPDGGLGVLWLDGRDIATTTAFDGGNMAVQFTTFDKTWKQGPESQVDARVCECCPTTAVMTPDGLVTAYRDRSDQEIRDIFVSRLEGNTWSAGQPVHKDNWEVFACPVNGPMLSAQGRTLVAAWFTAKGEQGQSWAAFSNDAGRTWGNPIRLDDGESTGRVDVEMLEDGRAVATWIEFADRVSQLRTRLIDPSGAKSPAITVARGELARGYPRLARQGNELVFAWTEGRTVKTATATLP